MMEWSLGTRLCTVAAAIIIYSDTEHVEAGANSKLLVKEKVAEVVW